MLRLIFFAGGAFLFTMITMSIFPALSQQAFTLGDFSVKGYMLLAVGLLGVGLKFGSKLEAPIETRSC